MKTTSSLLVRLFALVSGAALLANCTTTYDAYGRPQASVDPGVAIAGVAAAGLIGYALADDDRNRHRVHSSHRVGYSSSYRAPVTHYRSPVSYRPATVYRAPAPAVCRTPVRSVSYGHRHYR